MFSVKASYDWFRGVECGLRELKKYSGKVRTWVPFHSDPASRERVPFDVLVCGRIPTNQPPQRRQHEHL